MKLELYRQIFEKYSNFTKILPVGAELVQWDGRMDGRTDITKLIVAFRKFANALQKYNNVFNKITRMNYTSCETSSSVFSLPYLLSFRPERSALFFSVPPQPITMYAVCASNTFYRSTTTTVPPTGKSEGKR
jgi:hypothetical protein